MTHADIARPRLSGTGEGTRVRAITDVVTTRVHAMDTNGAFSLFEVVTPPGGGFPAHSRHHEDVVLYVLKGRYDVLVANRSITVGPGACICIPRGTMYGYANSGQSQARMQMIFSPGGIHEEFLADVGDDAGRQPWAIDMEKVLAVAPKYGIDFVRDVIDPVAESPLS